MLLVALSVKGNHYWGGEITWTCTDDSRFVVRVTLYEDCNQFSSVAFLTVDARTSATRRTSVYVYKILEEDISPSCNPYPGSTELSCGMDLSTGNGPGALRRVVYESDPVNIPQFDTAYGGILFSWDACCRGQSDNLAYANGNGIFLRAMMYAKPKPHPIFNNPRYICEHKSPSFDEVPQLVASTGTPLFLSNADADPQGDSIYYSWANLLEQPNFGPFAYPNLPTAFWDSAYSFQQPFPGVNQHPLNVPASMNHQTGTIQLTSYTQGNFLYSVKAEAWKSGELKAEVYRDAALILSNDSYSNQAPELTVIPDPTAVPIIQNGQNLYAQVQPGDRVAFDILAVDSNRQPLTGLPQAITFSASGHPMAQPLDNDSSGCAFPPCAVVLPANGQQAYSSDSINTVTFHWEPTCDYVGGSSPSAYNSPNRSFYFLLKMQDDYCSVPASTTLLLQVEVKASRAMPARLMTASFNGNGGADLHWAPPQDTGWRFSGYVIYYRPNQAAGNSFQAIDTILNYQANSWSGSNLPNMGGGQYFLAVLNPCNASRSSDTLHLSQLSLLDTPDQLSITIGPNPTAGQLVLTWNAARLAEGKLEVLDIAGKRIEQRAIVSGSNSLSFQLPEGVYLFRVLHEGSVWYERVVFSQGLNR